MRDGLQGGLLAFVVAGPIMIICCGGGGVFLAAILGGIGGWLSGLGGITTVIAASGAVLLLLEVMRHRAARAVGLQDETCCLPNTKAKHGADEIENR